MKGLAGPAKSVAAGKAYTCALLEDKTLQCWGVDDYGQLGTDLTATCNNQFGGPNCSRVPATVPGLSDVVAVSAGGYHACALLKDGTARCWGRNNWGQLGNGSTTSPPKSASPLEVVGLNNAIAISAGLSDIPYNSAHTCAVLSDQTVRCWGYNGYGELGNGSTTASGTPVAVPGVAATGIAVGWAHTCAVLTDKTVECWGYSNNGEMEMPQHCSPKRYPWSWTV